MTPRERRRFELDAVAERHGLTIDQVLSKKRTARIVSAKREIAKLLHGQGLGTSEIGRIFDFDHGSIHYLIRTQDRRLGSNRQ